MKQIIAKIVEVAENPLKRLMLPSRGKAPFSTRVMRGAGHWPYRKMLDRVLNFSLWCGIGLGFIIGVFASAIIAQTGMFWHVLLGILLVIFVIFIMVGRQQFTQMRNAQIGYYGELKVAEMVERLGRPDWHVFHGFDLEAFGKKLGDIDHIIVCPKGVFCVETKAFRPSRSKRMNKLTYTPGKSYGKLHYSSSGQEIRSNPLPRLHEKSRILHGQLTQNCGGLGYVARILALPEWEVECKEYDSRELVCSELDEIRQFLSKSEIKLESEQIKRIADFLDGKLRRSLEELH